MAFLRSDKKKSGTYLRIIESYKEGGRSKHRTLYSLGKLEDYTVEQIERIAKKLLSLVGLDLSDIVGGSFVELGRFNYGYAMVIQKLWKTFNMSRLVRKASFHNRVQFDWERVLMLLISERMNDPCSKRQVYFNQQEYLGFGEEPIALQHFYRTLDVLSSSEEVVKKHLFSQQRNLFTTVLDVVFYDVTTLYFDSHQEKEGALRQKGYSKDGKAHKTQIVLGLMVDKSRNPISYQIYQGNTYEGGTMMDALKKMQAQFTIDRVVVVADSAMIDKANRDFMIAKEIDYIIGDSIKILGKEITSKLLDRKAHKAIKGRSLESFSYREVNYKGRRIICTYSDKRARKDKHQRQLLIDKAKKWLEQPSKYKQVKKRGAGRFIQTSDKGTPIALDQTKIEQDAKYDGFKAIATSTKLEVEDILSKYSDLFEVEHSFRALKSQLEIRPVFHWTDARIRGHICMCFIAYTFINHLKNITELQYRPIIKTMDQMQVSKIHDKKTNKYFYLRAKITDNQEVIIHKLKLKVLNDTTPQSAINQYFTK